MNRVSARSGFTLIELMVVIAVSALMLAVLLPAVQFAREAARKAMCINNLRQVALGVVDQAEITGKWPGEGRSWPAQIGGSIGRPDLEFLDIPISISMGQEAMRILNCPSDRSTQINGFASSNVGVSGELAGKRLSVVVDGHSTTVLGGEIVSDLGMTWANNPLLFPAALSSRHVGGQHCAFADGHIRFLSSALNTDVLSALFSPDGGESVVSE